MNFVKGFMGNSDVGKIAGEAVGDLVETGLNSFLGRDGQQDDGAKEDKGGFSFGKFLSAGDDGKKDVNEEPPSGGQTDEDNSGFGLANALSGGGQKDPDNGGCGSGDAKGGGQKNDDNTGAGEPGFEAAAENLGDLL